MRLVIQRVSEASLSIEKQIFSSINKGLVVLLGVEHDDNEEDINYLLSKLIHLRIFSDNEGKMNLSLFDIQGELLLVSQFTLHASTKKGNRPSFIKAAKPEIAKEMYEDFIVQLNSKLPNKVKTGVFGANMQVQLINDGPVTIIIDSKNRE